jgi:hypothetical protein
MAKDRNHDLMMAMKGLELGPELESTEANIWNEHVEPRARGRGANTQKKKEMG